MKNLRFDRALWGEAFPGSAFMGLWNQSRKFVITRHRQLLLRGVLSLLIAALPLVGCSSGLLVGEQGSAPASDDADDSFGDPRPTELEPGGVTRFSGELRDAEEVDVWDLGVVQAGTRLDVELQGFGANFSIGLFDQDYLVRMISHNRYNSKDPRAILHVAQKVEGMLLVVASDPFEASTGRYTVQVTQSTDADVVQPGIQTVILNFTGGSFVSIGSVTVPQVTPFDAADLHPDWSEYTTPMKDIVMDSMQRVYDGLNVELYFSDDPQAPREGVTTVYFGAQDANNVGLAATIDYGNRNKQHNAIVYTRNFAKYISYGYTYRDLAQGFANVAAHELGHLLGLNHTDLPLDVMNVSPTVDALVAPQYFSEEARLSSATFPVGRQDGAELIFETVGGEWSRVALARDNNASLYAAASFTSRTQTAQQLPVDDADELSSARYCTSDQDN